MAQKVTPKTFDCVKTLLAGGASNAECAEYMQLSVITVGRIKKAETFEEYNQLVTLARLHAQKPVVVPEVKEEPMPEPEKKPQKVECRDYYQMNRLFDLLKEQNELLKQISAKMGFIVEQLA